MMALFQEGQTIRGTYEIERLIGEGQFGEVYRVKHQFFGRQAMKVMKLTGQDQFDVHDMLGEAILLSSMQHPNIVRIFEANTLKTSHGTHGFFTMEYVAGGSLDQYWRSFGNHFIPVETVIDIAKQLCRGLAVAHEQVPPIIHRDVKPQNILVGYGGAGLRAVLTDFGLAKRVNPLTMLASAAGTIAFFPPEVMEDPTAAADSCAGDVWRLGATLYLMLSDRLPYQESGDLPIFDMNVFRRALVPPSEWNARVEGNLDRVIQRALEPDKMKRYQSARELLDALESLEVGPITPPKVRRSRLELSAKGALGPQGTLDEVEARAKVVQAFAVAAVAGRLQEAADLLEEALNGWPDLRPDYEYRLGLWRRGVSN